MDYLLTALLFGLIAILIAFAPAFADNLPAQPAVTNAAQGAPPDPQMKAVLDELAGLSPKPIEMLEPADARNQPTLADAAKKVLKKQDRSTNPQPVGNVDDRKISYQPDNIPIRVYTPLGEGPFPVIVYYHGGGFVIATIDSYDASCRALCNAANAVVVAVEYRKAPESKYPAAVDDAFAAYHWVSVNAASIKGDPAKIAVAGESAGGNLATVVSMMAVEKGMTKPVFQLLVYPLVDNDMTNESYKENADAKPLNKAMMAWFFNHYLADPASAGDPHVLPMRATQAQLSQLPPAMIIAAQIDPLRTEGREYADKLQKAGVPVEYKLYNGVTHEFFGLGTVVDTAKTAESDAGAALKKAFGSK